MAQATQFVKLITGVLGAVLVFYKILNEHEDLATRRARRQ